MSCETDECGNNLKCNDGSVDVIGLKDKMVQNFSLYEKLEMPNWETVIDNLRSIRDNDETAGLGDDGLTDEERSIQYKEDLIKKKQMKVGKERCFGKNIHRRMMNEFGIENDQWGMHIKDGKRDYGNCKMFCTGTGDYTCKGKINDDDTTKIFKNVKAKKRHRNKNTRKGNKRTCGCAEWKTYEEMLKDGWEPPEDKKEKEEAVAEGDVAAEGDVVADVGEDQGGGKRRRKKRGGKRTRKKRGGVDPRDKVCVPKYLVQGDSCVDGEMPCSPGYECEGGICSVTEEKMADDRQATEDAETARVEAEQQEYRKATAPKESKGDLTLVKGLMKTNLMRRLGQDAIEGVTGNAQLASNLALTREQQIGDKYGRTQVVNSRGSRFGGKRRTKKRKKRSKKKKRRRKKKTRRRR